MIIYNSPTKYKNTTKYSTNNPNKNTPISFKAHWGTDKIVKNGIKQILRQETGFFRDIQTKKFVKGYIQKYFKDQDHIKIIVGGCSTGEEAYTYSMLLNKIKANVSILGFDLSPKAIEQAKSRKTVMECPQQKTAQLIESYSSTHKDAYLCFDTTEKLNAEQLELKTLFNDFYDITSEVPKKAKKSILRKLQEFYLKKLLHIEPLSFQSKIVKLKENKANNCSFVIGDIQSLGNITNGEKAHVITFSNALYHITTNEKMNGLVRTPKPNSEEIIKQNLALTNFTLKKSVSLFSKHSFKLELGNELFSQAVIRQVLSPLAVFTTVFGMGTGGFLPLCHQESYSLRFNFQTLKPTSQT